MDSKNLLYLETNRETIDAEASTLIPSGEKRTGDPHSETELHFNSFLPILPSSSTTTMSLFRIYKLKAYPSSSTRLKVLLSNHSFYGHYMTI
ncbi:hypothetical protein CFP56_017790 [Quercus suber]|uniref:Uncharacterized protein n=1 Tax=Quercus suber TaxID=58331 RepID=A0AAW0KJU0_QUESU